MNTENQNSFGIPALVAVFYTAIVVNYSIDSYLPSVPFIAEYLQTGASNIQLSVSLTPVGMGLGTFIAGIYLIFSPRRLFYYLGAAAGIFGEILCAFPPSLAGFISGRMLVGFAIGALVSVVVSTLVDLYKGTQLARINSMLMLIVALMPAVSPYAGGHIQMSLGWRYNFIAPLIMFVTVIVLAKFIIPETLKKRPQTRPSYSSLLADFFYPVKYFKVALIMICGLITLGCILAYMAIGPVLFEVHLKLDPVQYGSLAIYLMFAFLISAAINARYIQYGFKHIMFSGVFIAIGGACALMVLHFMGFFNVLVIVLPMTIFIFGINFIQMNTLPLATTFYKETRGNIGGIVIFVQTLFSSILGIVAAYLPAHDQFYLGMLVLIAAISLLGLLLVVFWDR